MTHSLCDLVTREGEMGQHRVRAREWGKHWDIHLIEFGPFTKWEQAPLKDLDINQAAFVLHKSTDELEEWANAFAN